MKIYTVGSFVKTVCRVLNNTGAIKYYTTAPGKVFSVYLIYVKKQGKTYYIAHIIHNRLIE